MTFDDLRSQMNMCRKHFDASVRDSFGRSIDEDVFDKCDTQYQSLQEAADEADNEKKGIEALLLELRLIL